MPAGSSAALATGANTVRAGIVHRTSTSASKVAQAQRCIAGCSTPTVRRVGHNVQWRAVDGLVSDEVSELAGEGHRRLLILTQAVADGEQGGLGAVLEA